MFTKIGRNIAMNIIFRIFYKIIKISTIAMEYILFQLDAKIEGIEYEKYGQSVSVATFISVLYKELLLSRYS